MHFERIEETVEFTRWLERLRDRSGRQIIVDRVDRFANRGTGDVKSVGRDVYELRIAFGPGYRVYFTMRSGRLLLLLIGGDKASQRRDIAAAQQLATRDAS